MSHCCNARAPDSHPRAAPRSPHATVDGDSRTGGVVVFARRVAVIGTGYVGLTTGACLASLGHRVSCADLDPGKVERLRRGEVGIREDGLAELVEAGIAAGRLSFVIGAAAALAELA